MNLTASEIAKAAGGALIHGSPEARVSGVSTDSRKEVRGSAFFALKGPNFDAHGFVADVLKRGATVAVVERPVEGVPASSSVILVNDTLKALGTLAAYFRELFKMPVVAVSGSAGKTTTKEMIAAILSRSRKVLKTEGNKNNLVGLPLTIFGLDASHEAAVLELGISEPWEMERLVGICRPDIALITNIGRGHLEKLGSIEGVARAKGPLFTLLEDGNYRIVNLDDPWAVRLSGPDGRRVTFSLKEKADVSVKDYSIDDGFGGIDALYEVRGEHVSVRFNTPNVMNVVNGAAAIAAALPLNPSIKDIGEGLASFSPVHGRMEVVRLDNITVLDDTYNANPESMASAMRTLGRAEGRKVAILGDMLELGPASREEHISVGRLAGRLGIDVVVAIGAWSKEVSEGARLEGVKDFFSFNGKKEAIDLIAGLLKEGDSVLVKGSRAVGLEEVVEVLKARVLNRPC